MPARRERGRRRVRSVPSPGKALDVATGLCVPVPDPEPNGVNPTVYPPDDQPF